jgi:predicted nucleotide-binding protein
MARLPRQLPGQADVRPIYFDPRLLGLLRRLSAAGHELAQRFNEDAYTEWLLETAMLIDSVWGDGSKEALLFSQAQGDLPERVGEDLATRHQRYKLDLQSKLGTLDSLIGYVQLVHEALPLSVPTTSPQPVREADESDKAKGAAPRTIGSRRVFVVHGHDQARKESVARLLERLELEPIILHEQPNAGRTIIEKFEAVCADVGFAIVLLTPDDCGGPARDNDRPEKLAPRARQNVILELGYFVGKLGRKHVCPLYEEGTEIPSDFAGVVYVPLDVHGAWRTHLAKELKQVWPHVDLNNL